MFDLNSGCSQTGRAVVADLNRAGVVAYDHPKGELRTDWWCRRGTCAGTHHCNAREVPARCWPRIPFSF